MRPIYRALIGFLFLQLFSNAISANTEIVEIIVKPSVELNFLQGLEKEEIKTFQIAPIIKKIIDQDLKSTEVFPLPKEPLEIVFPKVVIDDVVVYLQEKNAPITFAIGDNQYYMNTPAHLLGQHSPG